MGGDLVGVREGVSDGLFSLCASLRGLTLVWGGGERRKGLRDCGLCLFPIFSLLSFLVGLRPQCDLVLPLDLCFRLEWTSSG